MSRFPSLAAPLALVLAAAATALPAAAAMRLPAGAELHAQLASAPLNTKNAYIGEPFSMTVVAPYPGGRTSLANATVRGHVTAVRKGSQGRTAVLDLAFDRIVASNGESAPLAATVVSMAEVKENTTARKALGAGAGAAVGSQTVGRILGGTLGSVVGLAGGAAAGYAYGNNGKPNFQVERGGAVVIRTESSALITRRQG